VPNRLKTYPTFCLLVCLALAGCRSFQTAKSTKPFQYHFVRDQLVLHSDFPLSEQHRLVEELVLQRTRLSEKLSVPPTDEPIHIYLFANDSSYYAFLEQRFPGFPARRAIFVETDVELSVYAHWGDHVAEDLRHEVAHGYLHATVPNLPLWLDEGLAEYFEVARGQNGVNRPHVELLASQTSFSNWKPDLKRLERLASTAEMTQLDYAEAWAWVHYLLESEPLQSDNSKKDLLIDYLADLRQGAAEATLSARLEKRLAGPRLAMAEHVEILR